MLSAVVQWVRTEGLQSGLHPGAQEPYGGVVISDQGVSCSNSP